ncbi:MAG: hypothetical protein V3W41_22355 [Planctomycetota bacterium]
MRWKDFLLRLLTKKALAALGVIIAGGGTYAVVDAETWAAISVFLLTLAEAIPTGP